MSMGYINFTFTKATVGGSFPSQSTTFVGYSREGGRTDQVQHTAEFATTPREVYRSQRLVAATQALKDALSAAEWIQELRVTTDVSRPDAGGGIIDARWTTRHGATGSASSRADMPAPVLRVIDAASAVEALAARGRTQPPFVPGG